MLNLFFDVDYTIMGVDSESLRPGVREVFEQLAEDGHTIYIWSGAGDRTEDIELFGLQHVVSGVFEKPTERYQRVVQDMLLKKQIPVLPDLVVDDSAPIVRALGGIIVPPYGAKIQNDRHMERVYRIVRDYASNGHSHDISSPPVFVSELYT